MLKTRRVLSSFCCLLVFVLCLQLTVRIVSGSLNYEGSVAGSVGTAARVVKKEERTPVVATEFGSISAVDINDGVGRNEYHLQFITMEPNALFLPVLLHADMVFFVHTGSGRLSWTEGDDINKVSLQRGDVYRMKSGTLFYLHSNVDPERSRFRIIALFSNPDEQLLGPSVGPYSSVTDLVRGFDKPVLQAAFQVPEEVIDELTSTTETPAIVEGDQNSKKKFWEEELIFINALFGIPRLRNQIADNKNKHTKTFNIYKEDPDFKNCHGWSKVVTKHDLHALRGSQIGVFMVNLSKGSIMGPHWNPAAAELSVVIEGEGMVQVVCPSALTNKECKNSRIRVEEGDVFTVPRFHPMAQTSFNNGSLVFMGFSTASKKNHPQFLAGKASVLQTLDKFILGVSFNVSDTTVGQLLAPQKESIILDCTSCAEEQEIVMEEEMEKERKEEEERKREEEEARRREEEEKKRHEEEERKRREEEEERKRREEEERKRREEEERKREEEEEEAARRQEEEEKRRQEEEEEKRRREEEERKKREEEERKREEEEEAARRQEEEEKRRQEEEEEKRREEEERKREEEEEAARRQEEEEKRRQEEEEKRRREEAEEKRRREEEERKREEEEEERKREEEAKRREEEERKREEEEAKKREQEEEEEKRQQEEEKQRQQEQEEERRREEESRSRQEEEQKRREQEEEQRRQQEEEEQRKQEEDRKEEQRRQEEQQQRQQEEEREEKQRRQEEERKEEQRKQEEEQQRQQEEGREEEQGQEEKKRQQEEQQRRQEEWQERQRQEKEQRKRDEGQRRREEERGRGEGESEEEMARREEEERIERQREQEEGGWRWGR
ncbi:uncharacterized protein LOC141643715 isoform X2 [Silene latifolia]|uniref:uncharacterized protein LOC141643715 isoform X2 n=1 Tax=Silene latifolia TaxID=37657 RepID=UPI003D76F161